MRNIIKKLENRYFDKESAAGMPPKKQAKYKYYRVIQQNYGQGWEDCSEYEANSQFVTTEKAKIYPPHTTGKNELLVTHDLREYRLMGYPTRVINRKIKNQ